MEDTWASRDLPILDALVSSLDDPDGHLVQVSDLAEMTGIEPERVAKSLRAMTGSYVTKVHMTLGDVGVWYVTDVTPEARRAVGQWPTAENVLARLVAGFDEAAEREQDPERKSRLRSIAAGLGGSARDVATDIIARVIEHKYGL